MGDRGEQQARILGELRAEALERRERLERGHAERRGVALDEGDEHGHERGRVLREGVAQQPRHLLEQGEHLQQQAGVPVHHHELHQLGHPGREMRVHRLHHLRHLLDENVEDLRRARVPLRLGERRRLRTW